jgi:hypothetical protein
MFPAGVVEADGWSLRRCVAGDFLQLTNRLLVNSVDVDGVLM